MPVIVSPIELPNVAEPRACDGHKLLVFFDENNLSYIPTLVVINHNHKELAAALAENGLIKDEAESQYHCMYFINNWRGARRYFVITDPTANITPPYNKFIAELILVQTQRD